MNTFRFEIDNLIKYVSTLPPEACHKLYIHYKIEGPFSYNKVTESLANMLRTTPLMLDSSIVNKFLVQCQKTFKNYEHTFENNNQMAIELEGYPKIDVFVQCLFRHFNDLRSNVNIITQQLQDPATIEQTIKKAQENNNLVVTHMDIIDAVSQHKNDPELLKKLEYDVNYHVESAKRMLENYFARNFPNLIWEADIDIRIGQDAIDKKRLT